MAVNREQFIEIIDALQEDDKELVFNLAKKLVRAWDKDFTKLTPSEKAEIAKGESEIEAGEFVKHNEINWD